MEQIGSYINGNTIVVIYEDGTKVRYIKDGETPAPEYPESIDLKITNRCDAGCPMCAEASRENGMNANLNNPLLDTLHPYTELAIGGGNPLEHPDLQKFLHKMREKKIICNITVNAKHFMEYENKLEYWSFEKMIYGLGISVPDSIPDKFFDKIKYYPNAVVHTIAGYTPLETYFQLMNHDLNLLILGFKNKGFGAGYMRENQEKVNTKIRQLESIVPYFRKSYKAVAFDNNAVSQLNLKQIIPPEEFDRLYMGDDGEYTMYIDLVTKHFSKSSSHQLEPIEDYSIDCLFSRLHSAASA